MRPFLPPLLALLVACANSSSSSDAGEASDALSDVTVHPEDAHTRGNEHDAGPHDAPKHTDGTRPVGRADAVADAPIRDAGHLDVGASMRVGMNTGTGATVADEVVYGGFDKMLGVSAVRIFFPVYYYDIRNMNADTADSGYFKDNYDELLNRITSYHDQGFKVTVTISGSTCGSNPNCPTFPQTLTTKRADGSGTYETEFDTYMASLLGYLGDTLNDVSAIEVWNEWDDQYGFTSDGGTHVWTAAEFVPAILEGGYDAIKAVKPSIQVIAGAVVMNHESDIGALVAAGAAKYADGFSYHPYYERTADLSAGLARAKSYVPAGKSLYLTEWGCDTADASARADNLTASFPILREAGLSEADYFIIFSQGSYETTFGLLNATVTGHDPTTEIVDASPRQPLFNAFKAGSL
jgi:hypothetical protein